MNPPTNYLAAGLLTLLIVFATLGHAQEAVPPYPPKSLSPLHQQAAAPSAGTVTAIVVKSWNAGDDPVWADLNANYSTYGPTPVSINYTTLGGSDFTYTDLLSANADVIIISDAAGGQLEYSPSEITAISRYVQGGHPILATFATFQLGADDNRGLAPIFGFDSTLTYSEEEIFNDFASVAHGCLLRQIPDSWHSNGFYESQVPVSGMWTGSLGHSTALADSDNYSGVITVHPTQTYTGIYISNMPEYLNVGGYDEQLLYNAITCYVKK